MSDRLPPAVEKAQKQVDDAEECVVGLVASLKVARKSLKDAKSRRDRILREWNKNLPLLADCGVLDASDGSGPTSLLGTE